MTHKSRVFPEVTASRFLPALRGHPARTSPGPGKSKAHASAPEATEKAEVSSGCLWNLPSDASALTTSFDTPRRGDPQKVSKKKGLEACQAKLTGKHIGDPLCP